MAGVSAVSATTSWRRHSFSKSVCGGEAIASLLLYRRLGCACRAGALLARARAGLCQLDAIDDLEECPRARLHDVGAHARAAVAALVVYHVDHRLALRILTLRDAADLELPQHHADAGCGFDRLECRIDRTVAGGLALHRPAIRMSQLHHRGGGSVACRHGVEAGQAPGTCRGAVRAEHQRLDVAVEQLLFLVGQRLELLEYPVELSLIQLEPEGLH